MYFFSKIKQKPIILLVLFSVLAYHLWFSFNIYTNGDWWFNYSESIAEQTHPNIWYSNFGTGEVEPTIFRSPINLTIGYLSSFFNIDSHIIDRIIFFWPIIFLLPIASYFFIKKIVKNELAAFVGAFVVSFNTYFLTIDTEGHGLITTSFSFAITALYFLISAIEDKKYYHWIFSALSLSIAGFIDFRILYVTMFIIAIIYIKEFNPNKNFVSENKPWLVFGLVIFLSNIFWLIPLPFMESGFGEGVLSRPLFGDQFWSLSHAITLTHPFWTGGTPIWFSVQPIPFYFWLTPILAILGLLVTLRSSYSIAFGFVALLGIFLSKQSDAPVEWFYTWAYQNFPGFNAFREASKFYILILISYGVLIGFFVKWLTKQNIWPFIKYLPVGIFCILLGLNTLPMIDGGIKTMFIEKNVNTDYLLLKNKLTQDKEFFRTYWVPISTKWTFASNNHPKGNILALNSNILFSSSEEKAEDKIINIISQSYSDKIFDSMSVRYIGVPTSGFETYEDNFKSYGGKENPNIRQWYIDQLDSLPYLKRVDIGTEELVIYENENYLPHIRTTNSITQYDSFANLNDKYKFTNDVLNLPFDFTVPKENKILFPTTRMTQPYDKITFKNLSTNALIEQLNSADSSYSLYTNTSSRVLSYKNEDGIIQFQSSYTPSLAINSQIIDQSPTTTILSKILLDAKSNYIAITGSRVIYLTENNDWQVINTKNKQLDIFEISAENALPNGSFEDGLWQEKVGDCNDFDELPILGMTRSEESTRGLYSLELSATRHTACTNTNITDLESGEEYLFSFEYKGKSAEQAGFYLSFNESTTTAISEKLPIPGYDWQRYEKVIRIPENITNPTLFLYAYPTNEETNNVVLYDDIQIRKINKIEEINPQIADNFVATSLSETSGEQSFSFSDPTINLANKIVNGDLAKGLWKSEVGDCNNYDEYGDLAMNLVPNTNDGSSALELEATRHTACTGPNSFPVIEGKTYLLTFDYQSDDKTEAGFNIGWNGTTTPAINERIQIKDSSWQTFDKQITVPDGASSASLTIYVYEDDGVTPIKVRYDNFSFIELPDIQNRYYLVSNPQTNFVEPKEITFDLINPTKKLVHIKGATTPFYLAMSESFHPQWEAQFNNEKVNGFMDNWVPFVKPDRIRDEHHFELNGFLNGWYIDTTEYCQNNNLCTKNPDGSYDLELVIEFFPQRWFYLGLLISGTTFVGLIGYLIYDLVRRRRNKVVLTSAQD